MKQTILITLFAVCILGAYGCASHTLPEQHTYLLRTTESHSVNASNHQTNIVFDHLSIPEYLRRQELIVLVNDREIRAAKHHRWAEPLEQSIERYLRDRLSKMIKPSNIDKTVKVKLHIDELIGSLEGDINLRSRYQLTVIDQTSQTLTGRFENSVSQQTDGYAGLVAGYETLLDELVLSMIDTLQKHGYE